MRAHPGVFLKYFVDVNGESVEVELGADGVRIEGELVVSHLAPVDGSPMYLLTVGARTFQIVVRRGDGRGRYSIWTDGGRFEVEALDERSRAIREMTAKAAGPVGPAPLVAPMPGMIVRVNVAVGDEVQAGQGLVVMEAMKMENELRASAPGRVSAIRVNPGQAVEKGAILVELA